MTTPAQAYGHPNWVIDVPVQGPTDEGLRAADCHFAQTVLPTRPACVDCEGPIPMWATQSLSHVRGKSAGIGERLSFGGVGALGFALDGPGDPQIWTTLPAPQQAWIADTLRTLNDKIVATTGSHCPTWNAASISSTTGCFQVWFNANYHGSLTGADGKPVVLRADGVFDQQTLDALRTVAALDPQTFKTPFPGTSLPGLTGEGKQGLSTGAMVGIGVAGAAGLGLIYAATRGRRRH